MANVVTGNPFILDTATDAVVFSGDFWASMIYVSSAGSADTFSLDDKNDNEKWAATSNVLDGSLAPTVFPPTKPLHFNGLKVPTLGGGRVFIYVDKMRG